MQFALRRAVEEAIAAAVSAALPLPAKQRVHAIGCHLLGEPLPPPSTDEPRHAMAASDLEAPLGAAMTEAFLHPTETAEEVVRRIGLHLFSAQPAVPSSRASFFGTDALLHSVDSGAIAPLSGRWLAAHAARGGRVARRQDLPPDAFMPPSTLRRLAAALEDQYGLLFVALSYRWLAKDEPDADGFHLQRVAEVARAYLAPTQGHSASSPLTAAFDARGLGPPDFALFWEYARRANRHIDPDPMSAFPPGLWATPTREWALSDCQSFLARSQLREPPPASSHGRAGRSLPHGAACLQRLVWTPRHRLLAID
jgi:hypothetical protein